MPVGNRPLVVAPYYPPHVGGLEQYALDTHAHWLSSGIAEELLVVTPHLPVGAGERDIDTAGAQVVRHRAVEPVYNFPVAVPGARRGATAEAIRRFDPTVVIVHTRFFPSTRWGIALARRLALPVVHVEHGADYVQGSRKGVTAAARVYDHTLGRRVLRSADEVVAVSAAAANFVKRLSGRTATVIRRGFDIPAVPATPSAASGVTVAYLGRLIAGKGLRDLVAALQQIDRTDVRWLIIGEGEERAWIERGCRELLQHGRLLLTGEVPHVRVQQLLRSCDLLVNPSHSEGLGAAVAEAATLGIPAVATDVGGVSEVVVDGQTGLLVPPQAPQQLAASLRQLIDDVRLRQQLGRAARAHMQRYFAWDLAIQRWRQVFDSLDLVSVPPEKRSPSGAAERAHSTALQRCCRD